EITVALGELQQIDEEVFDFALKEIMNAMGIIFKIKLKRKKSLLKCNICSEMWSFEPEKLDEQEKESIHFIPEVAHNYIKCPKCGSPDFKIISGRGVWLDSIKGD
ncbi:MAG: hydrogenase nickel incorporation protein HypA, partial [Candidatus Aenigmarchaeota archaeon]|nr:hydrogenase nickel incorporation protein HypA [Candidatus Aenigmarchaeota archaeon]